MNTHASPFHFSSHGKKSNPPILFLHGFMGDHSDWAPIIQNLHNDFFCITPDLPGHGNTPFWEPDPPDPFHAITQALNTFLDHLAIKNCILIGYSMGGRIALAYAVAQPHRVTKLVLESTSPGLKTVEERQARLTHDHALASALEKTPFEDFLHRWYDQPIFHSLQNNQSLRRSLIERKLRNDPHQLARALRAFSTGRQESYWQTIQSLPHPVLLIAGEHDPKYLAIAEEIAQKSDTTRAIIAPDSGHTVHQENPDFFQDQLQQFLSNSST